MHRMLESALAGLRQHLPTVVVLSALAALGWWGAVCDWKIKEMFPFLPHRPEPILPKAEAKKDNPTISPREVELDSEEAARQAGVMTGRAQNQRVWRTVSAPAVIIFDKKRYAHLGARASGAAWRVFAPPGEHVRKGDILALVLAPEAGKGRAEFVTAWVQHDVKSAQLRRLESTGSAIPERQVVDARQVVREARLQMMNAHQGLANLGLSISLDSLHNLSDEQVSRRVRLLGLPPEMYREPDLSASLLPIVAPFDGLIINRDLVVGEMTGPGQTAFTLADVRQLALLMDIREEDVDFLSRGQPVTFRSTTGQAVTGEITWISAEVDTKTRTIKAQASVENPTGRLRPATFGQVTVQVGSTSGVTVPDESVQWDGKTRRVFIRRDDKTFEPRLVLTGVSQKKRTELLDPRPLLAAGLVGQVSGSPGVLGSLAGVAIGTEVFVPVAAGERVTTTGSHVLKSEMLKALIRGED